MNVRLSGRSLLFFLLFLSFSFFLSFVRSPAMFGENSREENEYRARKFSFFLFLLFLRTIERWCMRSYCAAKTTGYSCEQKTSATEIIQFDSLNITSTIGLYISD